MLRNKVFIASTPYHVLVSCERASDSDFLIVVSDHCNDKLLDKLIMFSFSNRVFKINNGKSDLISSCIKCKKKLYIIKRVLNNKFSMSDMIVFNDVDPVTQWLLRHLKYNGRVIIFEEGIGLYRNMTIRHKILFLIYAKVMFGFGYEAVSRMGESKYVDSIMCFCPGALSSKQKMKETIVLDSISFNELKRNLQMEAPNYDVWFVGQPLVEDGVMDEKEYVCIVNRIIDYAVKHRKTIAIKPHPRENMDRIRLLFSKKAEIVENNSTPVELMIDSNHKTYVYTIYSSAVIGLSRLSNVKAYAVYKMTSAKLALPPNIDRIFMYSCVDIIGDDFELSNTLAYTC